jgi:hypothetical protein
MGWHYSNSFPNRERLAVVVYKSDNNHVLTQH